MSSQARAAAPVQPDGVESAHELPTAGPADQGIEQADGVDGSAIVKVRGDLDLCSSPELQSVLADLLGTRRPTILDLSAIRFIDCRGLAVVLWAAGAAKAEGWSFIVAAVRAPCLIRLSALTDVGSALPAYAATNGSQDLRGPVL